VGCPYSLNGYAIAAFVLDNKHRIMLWNKACEELTGFKSEDMISTDRQWQPFYDHKRPTVADVIIDKADDSLTNLYDNYSRSVLNPSGISFS